VPGPSKGEMIGFTPYNQTLGLIVFDMFFSRQFASGIVHDNDPFSLGYYVLADQCSGGIPLPENTVHEIVFIWGFPFGLTVFIPFTLNSVSRPIFPKYPFHNFPVIGDLACNQVDGTIGFFLIEIIGPLDT